MTISFFTMNLCLSQNQTLIFETRYNNQDYIISNKKRNSMKMRLLRKSVWIVKQMGGLDNNVFHKDDTIKPR